ncbi:MAG: Hpt domain-containing protein [Acidobacteria bacterium]|nr:Hpt domain-containing protein [Acidobacteriota bacterium]
MDLDVALSHVDGDRMLLRELSEIFIEDYPRMLAEMQNSVLGRDHATLERLAHTLKGRLAYFGAGEARDGAADLETMGRERDLAGAWKSLEELESAMAGVLRELESFCRGRIE